MSHAKKSVDAIVGVVIKQWFKACRDAALKKPKKR